LIDTLDLLRSYHRRAPFLFFNGNTFASIARQLAGALFAELPDVRRREVISVFAHYVPGVLDRHALITSVESLCESADYEVGDSVTTLKGSVRGKIVALLDDGRVE